ncbi:hypothetical protein [uncultured Roseivirga sp.]|uniref:hypothetical protein n=1 Tax=uncultured Roseivirga sp. TaxID=543088 RepID=UPI002583A971|nr:hypothetical protein [uncultured Roseivirga sp.]|tara:strand:+ start:293 stop:448 length:156 start_codon:yes stop_codon:yes gene_type:complete
MSSENPHDGEENENGQVYNGVTKEWITSQQYKNWNRDFGSGVNGHETQEMR